MEMIAKTSEDNKAPRNNTLDVIAQNDRYGTTIQILERNRDQTSVYCRKRRAAFTEAIGALTVVEYLEKFVDARIQPRLWKGAEGWGARCYGKMNGPMVGPCESLLDALAQLWTEVEG